jgi:hypothetical protein
LKKDGPASGPVAANVQGAIHVPTPLGSRKKKKIKKADDLYFVQPDGTWKKGGDGRSKGRRKDELPKDAVIRKVAKTLYVNRPVLNADEIIAWAKENGIEKCVQPDDMHVTLAFSRNPVDWPKPDKSPIHIFPKDTTLTLFGPDKDCLVLTFDSALLEERWQELCDAGCSWDWKGFHPHITLSYSFDLRTQQYMPTYKGPIVLGPEEFAEVNEDWKSGVVEKEALDMAEVKKIGARNNRSDLARIQQMHDHACALGANCKLDGDKPDPVIVEHYNQGLTAHEDDVDKVARICKVDESLGLVFGYAIVCTKDGKDYYDLNIDKAADGTVTRVPEHIPEASMLKAAVDFMQTARPGNEMHDGPDVGTFVFAFPMTKEIAKSFGIQTSMTGLMVAYKPTPEVFAKFKDGTYKGFSIEGRRITAKMLQEEDDDMEKRTHKASAGSTGESYGGGGGGGDDGGDDEGDDE